MERKNKNPTVELSPTGECYLIDGTEYDRTTHVTGAGNTFLQKLKAEQPGMLQRAADYGTAVHKITEHDDRGEGNEVDAMLNADPWLLPYLFAWREWVGSYVSKIIMVEQIVWSDRYRCAGTVDRIAVMEGDKNPAILDIKTGGLHDSIGMQLSFYRMAYNEKVKAKTKKVERIIAIQMPRKHKGFIEPKPKEYTSELERYEREFREAWEMYHKMRGDEV